MQKNTFIPPLISLHQLADLKAFYEEKCIIITPSFPNWHKSFVSGPHSPLFEVEHRYGIHRETSMLVTRTAFKEKAEGPPGHVHGGATAGLIDELMGVLVWHENHACVTQNLSIHYWKPLPLHSLVLAVTQIKAIKDKTIEVSCTLFNEQKSPFISSQGLFHKLTEQQLKKFAKIALGS